MPWVPLDAWSCVYLVQRTRYGGAGTAFGEGHMPKARTRTNIRLRSVAVCRCHGRSAAAADAHAHSAAVADAAQGPTCVGTRGPDAQGGAQGNFCERVATKTHSSSPAVHFKDLGGRQSNFCEDTARHHSHYLSWQPTISLPSVSIGREESYCESIHFRRSQ